MPNAKMNSQIFTDSSGNAGEFFDLVIWQSLHKNLPGHSCLPMPTLIHYFCMHGQTAIYILCFIGFWGTGN